MPLNIEQYRKLEGDWDWAIVYLFASVARAPSLEVFILFFVAAVSTAIVVGVIWLGKIVIEYIAKVYRTHPPKSGRSGVILVVVGTTWVALTFATYQLHTMDVVPWNVYNNVFWWSFFVFALTVTLVDKFVPPTTPLQLTAQATAQRSNVADYLRNKLRRKP